MEFRFEDGKKHGNKDDLFEGFKSIDILAYYQMPHLTKYDDIIMIGNVRFIWALLGSA